MNKYMPLLTTCNLYVVKDESSVFDLRTWDKRSVESILINLQDRYSAFNFFSQILFDLKKIAFSLD